MEQYTLFYFTRKKPAEKIVRYFKYWTDKSRDLVIVRLIKLIRTFAHRLVSLAF